MRRLAMATLARWSTSASPTLAATSLATLAADGNVGAAEAVDDRQADAGVVGA